MVGLFDTTDAMNPALATLAAQEARIITAARAPGASVATSSASSSKRKPGSSWSVVITGASAPGPTMISVVSWRAETAVSN